MRNILNKLKNNKKMVALYTDCDNLDRFHVAYIIDIAKEKVLECNVAPNGEYDGYSAEFLDDIYRIETDTEYLNKIKKLMQKNYFDCNIDTMNDDPFMVLLNLSILNKYMCCIYLKDYANQIIGYINKVEDNKVYVSMISDIAKYDGETVFYFNDIVRIMVNDLEARELDHLYKEFK